MMVNLTLAILKAKFKEAHDGLRIAAEEKSKLKKNDEEFDLQELRSMGFWRKKKKTCFTWHETDFKNSETETRDAKFLK